MRRQVRWLVGILAAVLVGAGLLVWADSLPGPGDASEGATASSSPTPSPAPRSALLRSSAERTTVVGGGDALTRTAAMSAALFASSPVVVLAPAADVAAQLRGASISAALGVPLLLSDPTDPSVTATELVRLGAQELLTVGGAELVPGAEGTSPAPVVVDARVVPAPDDDAALGRLLGVDLTAPTRAVPAGEELAAVAALERGGRTVLAAAAPEDRTPSPRPTPTALPPTIPSGQSLDAVVLTDGDPSTLAAVATARAAGLTVVSTPGGDPRASSAAVRAVAAVHGETTRVVAVGPAFGPAADLAWKVATAATGVELPGGGQTLFPGRRLVALYGTPGVPALGLLGEQDLPGSIARAQQLAAEYQALTPDLMVPGFEIIATIASRGAGADGDYSEEIPAESLLPWVQAARDAGVYVVLDLQPGRTDFLTQAQRYATLLAEPNVGLALDPEWRLKPDQVHLRQIGSVGIDEVNGVVTWLADLTRERALPQKLFVLHQFSSRMIVERERLDLSRAELAVMVHVDGQGSQPAKAGTWSALRQDAPAGLWWGWKNFVDEDVPMLTPEQTLQVVPTPELITYQ